MRNVPTVTALALALGLWGASPAVHADHHEGSGMEPAGQEAKEAPKEATMEASGEASSEAAAPESGKEGAAEEPGGEM